MAIVEIRRDAGILHEPDIIQYQRQVVVHIRTVGFFDDQRAIEPALYLFGALRMGVLPVCARVWQVEGIIKALTRSNRRLGQPRHPIHRIGQAQPVPMHAGRMRQIILNGDFQPVALGKAQFFAWERAIEGPERGVGIVRRGNLMT